MKINTAYRLVLFTLISSLTAGIIDGVANDSQPDGNRVVITAGSEWKVVDMSNVQIKEGSALDLTSLIEPGPAGKHGRLVVSSNGRLAFEDSPDIPRRFNGFNGLWTTYKDAWQKALASTEKELIYQHIDKLAELIARQGYDIVRPLALEAYIMKDATTDGEFNPQRLDHIDRFIAALKKNGIYTYWTIAAYNVGRADGGKAFEERNEMKIKMYLGDAKTRARWKAIAEKQLSHINPYTKITWKDDPAIAIIELYNEQETCLSHSAIGKYPQSIRDLIAAKWSAWLLEKYKNVDAISSAWGDNDLKASKSLDKITLPNDTAALSAKGNDFSLFFADLARAQMSWCEGVLRTAGYKGLISQFNWSKQIVYSAVRWETSEVSIMNAYTGGGYFGINHSIFQGSSTGMAANYFRLANATRFADRPQLITETHHWWNKYQHEEGLIFAPYSALQGFSAIMVHDDPVALEVFDLVYQPEYDWIGRNPVARANEFISAHLYRRGDVKEASHRVELQIPPKYLEANGNKTVNTEQDKIALMTGFSVSLPDLKRYEKLQTKCPAPDISIYPDSGAEMTGTEWVANAAESKNSKFSIADFAATLKTKGILPSSNLSNPAKGVFQSETGQITLRSNEQLVKVITPLSEGVSLLANRAEALDCLRIKGSSLPAAIAAISIDKKNLLSSSRIVLIYNTEMAFTGMELGKEDPANQRQQMFSQGKMPVLMRTGKLMATLKCENASKMSLYSLGMDGSRKEKLPLSVEVDGVLTIEIDTAILKEGPTPFFELAAE